MAYGCELGAGQHIYLDNQGMQTTVVLSSSGAGQQQQSSSGFQSGEWTAPPQIYRTSMGVVIKLQTREGDRYIQIQGSSMSATDHPPTLSTAQAMPLHQAAPLPNVPMQPMQPMQPMKMGDMEMNLNPMIMRMGNMELRMPDTAAPTTSAADADTPTRKFCNQCGEPIKPSDRFCSSCGNRLD